MAHVLGRRGSDIRRDLIGHDAPVMLLTWRGHSEKSPRGGVNGDMANL